MLNNLPTIIDGPGKYRSRDGRIVVINEVTQPAENENEITAFRAKGTIKKLTSRRTRFEVWHVSGRVSPLSERYSDIVAKLGV